MPRFTYVAKDANGKPITETTEANDQEGLIEKLQAQGYFIVSVQELRAQLPKTAAAKKAQESATPAPKKTGTFTHTNIVLEDLLIFARQLATMLEAGVTLLRSLDVIVSQVESKNFSEILNEVRRDVEQGASLSAALAKHPKVFNQFWVSLIEVGEASGTMPLVLEKLAFYMEQQEAFNSTIISAIIYPAILFAVACGAIAFFAFFVGPKFETIFQSFGVKLPMITVILLVVFKFVKTKLLFLVGGGFGIFTLIKKFISTPHGQLQFEKFLFAMPGFGRMFKLIVVERFASQMSILIDSGVPILYALDITQRLVSNKTCEIIVGDIKEGVREGELLVGPMQKSDFFPPMAIQMIMVGEETGELSKMLKHVSAFYQRQVETFMKRFATMVEPIMLVFMGAVIGVIVLAMFLPMFNITQLGRGGG